MAKNRAPTGLIKRGQVWHINKTVCGIRIRESTETGNLDEAKLYLHHKETQIRKYILYGERPKRLFAEAALKYINENQHKASLRDDKLHINHLYDFIAHVPLEKINSESLKPFIEKRKADKVKNRTINYSLSVVRRILNLAASEWLDEEGKTWLVSAPKIKMLPMKDARKPYPLSFEEQKSFFCRLPCHLREMAIFKVNTGCREQEVCSLRWEWEIKVPELGTSVFLIPGQYVKNRQDRLVVLNKEALNVLKNRRDKHAEFVFAYQDKPLLRMNNSAWKKARKDSKIPVRVHDLKHTYGLRLRASGVSFEDRQDLLGHKSSRITTHYCAPELINLIQAANKVCENTTCQPVVNILRFDTNLTQVQKRIKSDSGVFGITA